MSDDSPEEEPTTFVPSGGPDRDEMAASYLPDSDEWAAKTILDLTDPHAVAALSQLDKMFPEVAGGDDELQSMIDEFKQEFMKSRTSVGGKSREDARDIIVSMFGGKPDDNQSAGDALVEALGGDQEE